MYKYNVEFTFEHKDSALRPDSARYGSGVVPITTYTPVETQEDFNEIARVVGRQIPDCKRLVVNNVILVGDDVEPSTFNGELISGTTLDD